MARTTSRSLLLLLPAFLLTASIILTGAIPDRGGVGGREEGDSVEKGEEYPGYIEGAIPPSYSQAELMANVTYPELAVENGIEGRVILMIYLEKTGEIVRIEVLRAPPGTEEMSILLVEAAKEGIRKTRFTPAMVDGRAVRYSLAVTVEFKLR